MHHVTPAHKTQTNNDGFIIDEEFKNLLPPLNAEDFEKLEKSILKDGCRDPLVIWKEQKILVDGYNRHEICDKHGLDFKIEYKSFANRDEVMDWMIENQKSRRNMTKFQWAEVVLKRRESIALRAKANQRAGGGAVRTKSYEPVKTIEKLAKLAGMGSSTLRQVAFILKHADQRTIAKLRKGDANYSINGVWETIQESIDKERGTRSSPTKQKQRSKKSALPSPNPNASTEPPNDIAGHVIASLEELEQQYSSVPDRIDLYNMVGEIANEWANKKKIELALSQKKLS